VGNGRMGETTSNAQRPTPNLKLETLEPLLATYYAIRLTHHDPRARFEGLGVGVGHAIGDVWRDSSGIISSLRLGGLPGCRTWGRTSNRAASLARTLRMRRWAGSP